VALVAGHQSTLIPFALSLPADGIFLSGEQRGASLGEFHMGSALVQPAIRKRKIKPGFVLYRRALQLL
jgi:hypothetical protein